MAFSLTDIEANVFKRYNAWKAFGYMLNFQKINSLAHANHLPFGCIEAYRPAQPLEEGCAKAAMRFSPHKASFAACRESERS